MADQVTSITGTPTQPPASNSSPMPIKPVLDAVSGQTIPAVQSSAPSSLTPAPSSTPTPVPTSALSSPPSVPSTLPKPQPPTSQQVFPPKPVPTISPAPPISPTSMSSSFPTSPTQSLSTQGRSPMPSMMAPSPSSVPSPTSIQKPPQTIPSTSASSMAPKPPLPGTSASTISSASQTQSAFRPPMGMSGQPIVSSVAAAQPSTISSSINPASTSIKPGIPTSPIPMKVGGGATLPQIPTPQKVVQESPKPMSPQSAQPQSQSIKLSSVPPQPQGQPPKEQPTMKMASPNDVKQSPFKFLPIILGVLALLGIVWFVITKFFGGAQQSASTTTKSTGAQTATPAPVKQTTLTYWGLWESSPVMDQVLKDFSSANPGVTVNYVQQSSKDYRERLADALKKGTGPDVFRYHATWVPMLKSGLSAMPASVMSADEYAKTFYPIVLKQLKTTDGIVGIPLMYDGLGLYYNKQIFTTANMAAPTSWAEVETAAKALTVKSKDKKIERAGIAMGTTANVDNFSDILGLLILQNGGDPSQPSTKLVADTLRYYTNFYKTMKVWDETLPSSTYAFATEKSAMMIAPSWRAFEVKSINPNIQFAIAPVPQLPGTSVAWASYWAEGVAKTSKQQDVAWKFLKYMSSKEVLLKMHEAAATKTPRLFGEIYPRTDMTAGLASDPYIGAFLSDAPKATSWWMTSRTFDNGINDKIIKYYEDAVNAVNLGTSTPEEALKTTQQGVQQVLLQSQQ